MPCKQVQTLFQDLNLAMTKSKSHLRVQQLGSVKCDTSHVFKFVHLLNVVVRFDLMNVKFILWQPFVSKLG